MKVDLEEKFLSVLKGNIGIVHSVCRIYTQNHDEHQDLYQEIVYQLWKSYRNFDGSSKFTTWMYRVALNTALSGVRKRYKAIQQAPLLPSMEEIPSDTEESATDERITMLYEAMNDLSPFDKALILLYLEERSYEEMAAITGITKGNVSVKLVRIKKKLEDHINKAIREQG